MKPTFGRVYFDARQVEIFLGLPVDVPAPGTNTKRQHDGQRHRVHASLAKAISLVGSLVGWCFFGQVAQKTYES